MAGSHVLCRRCHRWMVPRVIYSRSFPGVNGWRVGGGKPISNCCPFCLSEYWDELEEPSPLRGSLFMKLLSIPLTLILFALLFGSVLKLSVWLDSSEVLLAGNILSVYGVYRFGRWFVN
ncbi:hypothetical protein [Azotobacter armeniacus]